MGHKGPVFALFDENGEPTILQSDADVAATNIGGTGSYLVGAGAPGAGLGTDGQCYIDRTLGVTYVKVGGVWVLIANGSNWADKPAASAVPAGTTWTMWDLGNALYASSSTDWLLAEGLREMYLPGGPLFAYDDTTSVQTLASFSMPASAPGPNDEVGLHGLWACHNSAAAKTAQITVAGTSRAQANLTTNNGGHTIATIRNLNSRSVQVAQGATMGYSIGHSVAPQDMAVNFGAAVTFAFAGSFTAPATVNVSTFTSLVRAVGVVTMVVAANPLVTAGGYIRITGNTDAGAGTLFNGTFLVASSTGAGPYTVTWNQAGNDRTASTLDGTFNRALALKTGNITLKRGAA